ncbi:MAG: cytochrome c-type biogenesis protein CcmH [Magnetococcales bacterium]|nr:cytochrome c-type biogenesis protein CcmH [Magnetococcales bacterium]
MRHSSPLPVALMLGSLLLVAVAGAAERGEEPSEELVRRIAKDLRCAVCQNQSVYESNSDLAKDMLGVIRDKVRAGETEPAIRDYFLQRYGDYIYLEPLKSGGNWILWAGPFLGLLIGGGVLWKALRRWRRPAETGAAESGGGGVAAASAAATSGGGAAAGALHDRIKREMEQVEL